MLGYRRYIHRIQQLPLADVVEMLSILNLTTGYLWEVKGTMSTKPQDTIQ
jgi:hypothetical protein